MKKTFKHLIIYFFIIYSCNIINKKINSDQNSLNFNFTVSQSAILNKIIKDFDSILNLRYKGSMRLYLINLSKSHNTLKTKINKNWTAYSYIRDLKKTKLLEEMYLKKNQKYKANLKIKKWVDSIRNSRLEKADLDAHIISELDLNERLFCNEINYKNIDSQANKTPKIFDNYYGKFYYGLYKSLKHEDVKIKKLIANIVKLEGIYPFIYIDYVISTFNEKELSNKLFKLIIFSEIILPNIIRVDDCC